MVYVLHLAFLSCFLVSIMFSVLLLCFLKRGGKWELPGWRIEQKYCQRVLIGNWSEERLGKVRV